MKSRGNVYAQPTGWELILTCDCGEEETFDCDSCCNEPLDEAKEQGWLFKVTKDGAIFAYCSEECLKADDDPDYKDLDTGKASFDEPDSIEVRV